MTKKFPKKFFRCFWVPHAEKHPKTQIKKNRKKTACLSQRAWGEWVGWAQARGLGSGFQRLGDAVPYGFAARPGPKAKKPRPSSITQPRPPGPRCLSPCPPRRLAFAGSSHLRRLLSLFWMQHNRGTAEACLAPPPLPQTRSGWE